jgi:dTDP-glucose 4,6-dehydratase
VEDHCRGIELVLQRGEVGQTYNIGGNNEWNNLDIVHLLCDQMDSRFAADPLLAEQFPAAPGVHGGSARDLITFVEDRAGHDWRYAIDAGKIMSELGYAPRESFETGLQRTLDWFLSNEQWWQPLLPD